MCSNFLQETLHTYIQKIAIDFEMHFCLHKDQERCSASALVPTVEQNITRLRLEVLEKNLVGDWKRLVGH